MSTLYLVRHAHAEWTPDENRPLSAQGSEDANRVANTLYVVPISAIYSSPARRARQTIAPLAGRLGLFHDDLLLKLVGNESFGKIVISSGLKRDLLKALRARTVTATSLEHVGADRLGFRMSQERRAESVPRSGA